MANQSVVIENQVKLPLAVAFGVVMQGIRIRFGRSVVTIMGVMLGIAFLMSILTGQVVKKGVEHEETLRVEVRRMYSFLTAETGIPRDRVVGVIQVGPVSPAEERLIATTLADLPKQINWHRVGAAPAIPGGLAGQVVEAELDAVGVEASAVLILGQGAPPQADWDAVLAGARQKVVGLARREHTLAAPAGVNVVALERELKQDEKDRIAEQVRRDSFRNGWIIVVALCVTIIGIMNAMLMSVTERFKEIGTMKCLGSLSAFIRQIFLIESSLMGVVGSAIGALFGMVFALVAYAFTYGFGLVLVGMDVPLVLLYFLVCLVVGLMLSVLAAVYPANVASRMVPATALRTTI